MKETYYEIFIPFAFDGVGCGFEVSSSSDELSSELLATFAFGVAKKYVMT